VMTTSSNGELSGDQKAFVRQVVKDTVLFAKSILGVQVWKGQVEILRSIKSRRRTAVKACHSAGKTFALAIAALWWLARHPEGIVLTTSPTFRQVRTQLSAESIASLSDRGSPIQSSRPRNSSFVATRTSRWDFRPIRPRTFRATTVSRS
jgi:hypothetical protein